MDSRKTSDKELHLLPPSLQESVIVDDLLFAFMGLDGKYVRVKHVPATGRTTPQITFMLDASLAKATAELVERVLPIW